MAKRFTLVGVLVVAVAVVSLLYLKVVPSNGGGKKIHVCTWSNYFSDKVLDDFRKKTGIKVELTYMSSNEELFSKLKAGATGYDVIQPSDYMVRQMAQLKMLKPINQPQLPNLKYIDEKFRNLPYDPGLKYSVPFNWGTTGIAVNTKKVQVPAEGVTWKMLFQSPDPRHTSLLDDQREVFGAGLLFHGKSINEKDVRVLEPIKSEIQKVKNGILTFTSEPKALLLREEVSIAHIYSCDGAQAHFENPAIQYFIPKEGATLWTDNFAVPSTSEHETDAYQFIDYFLNPETGLPVFQDNHLGTPNSAILAKINEDERKNPALYPTPEVMKTLQMMDDLGDSLNTLTRMWTELKS